MSEAGEEKGQGDAHVKYMKESSSKDEDEGSKQSKQATEDEGKLGGPRFSPPLYRQRYMFCADILEKHGIKSVVDFGCAECQIMMYLRQVACLERIGLVDRDVVTLELSKHKIQPLITDHLDPRDNPLTVEMYLGSVTDYDPRVAQCDAVTMIELIEHLTEPELKSFPDAIFGRICPRLILITTPNADFNQLFPDLTGFRHWDHKFEWTTEEFQNWCRAQADKYEYDVEFSGVGMGPPGSEPLGYCSQAAIFVSKSPTSSSPLLPSLSSSPPCDGDFKYTLISSAVHPHKTEKFTLEEKMLLEVNYCLNHLSKDPLYSESWENAVLPIGNLHKYVKLKELFKTEEDLRFFLADRGYPLTPDSTSVIFRIEEEGEEEEEEGEGVEWGYQPMEPPNNDGQFSDAEEDLLPWNPPESEECWPEIV
ncbi:small RNA 2'-O-methyltransferase-like [Liolophura sinensis]|uniref:small RNA 2'-O-methyltransferase-like n=1 Tax=Liolophura sinensis TaxID=3198878 RepID=UPI0031597B52